MSCIFHMATVSVSVRPPVPLFPCPRISPSAATATATAFAISSLQARTANGLAKKKLNFFTPESIVIECLRVCESEPERERERGERQPRPLPCLLV